MCVECLIGKQKKPVAVQEKEGNKEALSADCRDSGWSRVSFIGKMNSIGKRAGRALNPFSGRPLLQKRKELIPLIMWLLFIFYFFNPPGSRQRVLRKQ